MTSNSWTHRYGRDWKDPSCVIDVVLDYDRCALSFFRNGVSQGIAFADLPKNKTFLGGVSLYSAGDSVKLLSFERLLPRRTPCPMKMIGRWKGRKEKQGESYIRCSRGAVLTRECYALRVLLRCVGGVAFMYLDGFLARGIDSIRKLRKLLLKEQNVLEEMGLRRAHARIISRIVRDVRARSARA